MRYSRTCTLALLILAMLAGGCQSVPMVNCAGRGAGGPIRVTQFQRIPADHFGKVCHALDLANQTLLSEHFSIALAEPFRWDASGPETHRWVGATADERLAWIRQARSLRLRGWSPQHHGWAGARYEAFTRVEENTIYLNIDRVEVLSATEIAEVIAHEYMHIAGFSHPTNCRAGNEGTVPYRVGDLVRLTLDHQQRLVTVGEAPVPAGQDVALADAADSAVQQ